MRYPEVCVRPLSRMPSLLRMANVARHSVLDHVEKGADFVFVSFGDQLDRAIREISYRAGDPMRRGDAEGRISKPDTLNGAREGRHEPFGCHAEIPDAT